MGRRSDAVIVQAPMAGGPSTVDLAVAVCEAGGLGSLAGGYKPVDAVRDDIRALRARTDRPFNLNLFVIEPKPVDDAAIAAYGRRLQDAYGIEPGRPAFTDDDRAAKIALAVEERVPVVSLHFGCPAREELDALHGAGCEVWLSVTEPAEARIAQEAGIDVLIVQGAEAGGHRGTFEDADGTGEIGLLALLQLVRAEVDLPLVAAGGIMDGRAIAAALAAGATAAQLGTAFLLCPEAGTSPAHREAMKRASGTALTRAFTGRRARAIVNRIVAEQSAAAPPAFPQLAPVVAPVQGSGDPELGRHFAGQAFALARELPAGELLRTLHAELEAAR